MPKAKTHSGTAKRVKITASGRFKHKRTGMRHMLRNKAKKAKRHLNGDSLVTMRDDYKIRVMMRAKAVRRPVLLMDFSLAELMGTEETAQA